ncbi:uncharacterized protein LOC108664885 isoform X2 [Hyalella azteca]|uniref:Uncharacterized protein LOC108664885 isoform X2 n=1 Tax=Hyalella azteca TaxID=294128 RepID=A0A8B7MZQ9_HYAAZ|nr:uncharacterized protein LOC108664885 isoform X2 [Hyalella azteca]
MSTVDKKEQEATALPPETTRLQNFLRIEDPSAVQDVHFIGEVQDDLYSKYIFDESKSGKWMIFVKHDAMFSMWKKSCNLYREGKLEGIHSMKVSTSKPSPRTTVDGTGVIIFYCGPCDDQELMMRYGRNLVTVLQFFNSKGAIPYKSDAQTALGTRATGCKVNSMYWLRVPRTRDEWKQHEGKNFWRDRGISSSSGNWRSELTRSDRESWRSPGKYKDLEKSTRIDQASWRSPVNDRTSWRSTRNDQTSCKATGNDRTSNRSTGNDRISCKSTGNAQTSWRSTGNNRTSLSCLSTELTDLQI